MRDRDDRPSSEQRPTPPAQKELPGRVEEASGLKTQASNDAADGRRSSGIQLPAINLPRGGGAIRGIGEKFSTNPVTGTGSLSIPVATSAGRAGFNLGLALQYDSGSGNGPFGIGWGLSPPSISRKTDKGLPRYDDANGSDIFILAGAEDLVPARRRGGEGAALDIVERNGYHIQSYRPRTESAFARIERWTAQSTGDTHWRVTSKDNLLYVYGRTATARTADPEHPGRIFSWLLEETRDDRGSVVRYVYKPEDGAGVDGTRVSEAHRFALQPDGTRRLHATAQRYVKRIQYGNRTPILDREQPVPSADNDYLFEVVFDYGEHDDAAPTPAEARPWMLRQDPFSHYRAAFEVRTYRLCQRILMFHRMAELGPTPCLVRSTDLTYDEGSAVTYLQTVTQAGYKRNADGTTYLRATLPSIELGYVRPVLNTEMRIVDHGSLAGIPGGVEGTGAQWVDLNGEGIPGALISTERAWFYKQNLGVGRLGGPTPLPSLPTSADLGNGAQQLTDVDGDGRFELVMYAPPLSGFFERTADGEWAPFRTLPSVPRIDWHDPNLRFLDLDGDGLADLLIPANDAFLWYRSRGSQGFMPGQRIAVARDERKGPALVFASSSEIILTADMSGDGLSDLVRVRNGEVCYWPNLGYGRFGDKVTLELSASFDRSDRFEPRRIRVADVDGTGTSDIIYVGNDGIRLYFNRSGNALSEPTRLDTLPPVDSMSHLSVVDLLGQGTACLVWSSPVPESCSRPLTYVDLLSGKKPHLLETVVNNLGAETRIFYVPSTRFYLADKAAGRPWITRLPFPVHVVERVETFDRISQNRFVTGHTYHHGFFDGVEREYRGFGMVEQLDTELLAALTADGTLPASNVDAASHVPPVLTRTWFHTGAFLDGQRIARQFAAEYYREPGLSDDQFSAQLLPDTALDPAWSAEEMREACRSLRGSVLRQEVYALDDSTASAHAYSVSERSYNVTRLQPRVDDKFAVFFVHPSEAINYHYERNSSDPRIQHELTLEVDAFGNVCKSAAIGYGRRRPDPALSAAQQAEQGRLLITYAEHDFTNPVDENAAYRTPLPCESRSYEITGLSLPAGRERFGLADMRDASRTAALLAYEQKPTPGSLQKRLIARERTIYRRDDLSGPLALGHLESQALPFETYKQAFTPGLVAAVYGDRVTDTMLATAGGYVHLEGDANWWIPSGRMCYSLNDGTVAEELAQARRHFFLPRRFLDPFQETTTFTYEPYDLLVWQTCDAAGNRVTVGAHDGAGKLLENGHDYRVLQPGRVMDPNRNRQAVVFDALGRVVGTAVMGKPEEKLGDSVDGFEPDLPDSVIAAHLKDPLADAHSILQHATTRLVYDLFAYQRTAANPTPQAPVVYTLLRETHDADLSLAQKTKVQHSFSYSDGFSREIQKKIQAESGPISPGGPSENPRWVGSGWTVFNNKGKPIRKYEPFFSNTHHCELGKVHGVSSILFYDPAERVVATLHPNHTYEKVIFDPWQQVTWDVNDTILQEAPQADPEVGGYFSRLLSSEYLPTWYAARKNGGLGPQEQAAANKTAAHANTPTRAHFDSLGRTFLTIADNGADGKYATRLELDIEGNQREVRDARDRAVMRYDYDLLGAQLHQASMEAGDRWMLNDVAGKPIYAWDSRGHMLQTSYDVLRRPIELHLREGSADALLVGRTAYGEAQAGAESKNLRGKVYQVYDGAGVVTSDAYDFKGNVLQSTRQIAVEYKDTLDWSADVPLESRRYPTSTTYDALNRPVTMTTPDQSVIRPAYNEANLLERIEGNLRGAVGPTVFVKNIDYNAKGQRELIEYGNGVKTGYTYDLLTFRLVQLSTTRGADKLQDLEYTYDPVGNITHIGDEAQQTIYFRNRQVEPSAEYTYDPTYRLIEATGREHLGQAAGSVLPPTPPSNTDIPRVGLLHPGDGNAMGRYIQKYVYDQVGNILQISHRGTDPVNSGWTRDYAYNEANQLDSGQKSNRLSSTTVGSSTERYTCDVHGNMVAMPHLPVMRWNYRNQLQASARQSVTAGMPETTYYVYDGSGQRVRKVTERTTGTRKNERIYIGDFEIYREYKSDGETVERERETLHIRDDEQRVALVETRTAGEDPAPAVMVRYQLGNHLGSAALELDAIGLIISYEEYYPYGSTSYQAALSQTETPKRYRFTGKERDEENAFYYHGARYYAPWLGRWTSCDAAGLVDGLCLYCYAKNEPTNLVDKTGHQASPWAAHTRFRQMAEAVNKSVDPIVNSAPAQVASGVVDAVTDTVVGIGTGVLNLASRTATEIKDHPAVYAVAFLAYGPMAIGAAAVNSEIRHQTKEITSKADALGGGFLGWFVAANQQLNPAYGIFEHGERAIQAASRGDWHGVGSEATHTIISVAATAALAEGVAAATEGGAARGAGARSIEPAVGAVESPAPKVLPLRPATAGEVVHGNSRLSTRAQHGYEIVDTMNREVVKTGVSGGARTASGSVRGNRQASAWNRAEGQPGRYEARVVQEVPAGPGARQQILQWEVENAARLREAGQLRDPTKHSRP